MNWTTADIERIDSASFDPAVPLATLEDIRERIRRGYVVYQHQFRAFVEAYDKLWVDVQRLKRTRQYLETWARTHRASIERYRQEQEARIPQPLPPELVELAPDWEPAMPEVAP